MKKIIALILAISFVFCLCSCGEKEEEKEDSGFTIDLSALQEEGEPQEKESAVTKVKCRIEDGINRYESNISAFEKETVDPGKIVFYGSSGFTRWSEKYGNTPLEDQILAKDGSKICVNRGFGGSTVHELLYYYYRVILPLKPKALVVTSFLNDYGFNYTNEEIMELLSELFENARNDIPGIKIWVTDYRPTAKSASDTAIKKRNELNKMLKDYCDKHDDTKLIELSKAGFFYMAPGFAGTYRNINENIFIEDKVHYTQEGYNKVAEVFKAAIDEVL